MGAWLLREVGVGEEAIERRISTSELNVSSSFEEDEATAA